MAPSTPTAFPPGPLQLPPSTKVPMERANPLLSCAIGKWLKAHGKTVKPKLSESQKADARMCFKLMDADGSGAIDAEELGAAFRLLGISMSHREVEAMLAEVDRDGSGEVEFAEFLEIMTMQLTRMAAEKDGAGASPQAPAGASVQGGDSGSANSASASGGAGGGGGGLSAAGVLPFDVVATAYRRKKLLGALEDDDKEFILSVAAAEEEERQRAEADAAAAAAGGRNSRRPSTLQPASFGSRLPSAADFISKLGRLSPAHGRAGGGAGSRAGGAASAAAASHASFLDSLSKEERRIIETLSRKYRDEGDVLEDQPQQQQQRHSRAQGAGQGSGQGGGSHLAALQQTAAAAAHAGQQVAAGNGMPSPLPLRPASQAAVRRDDFSVSYQLTKTSQAAAAAAGGRCSPSPPQEGREGGVAPGNVPTDGLLLPAPLFSGAGYWQARS